MNNENKELEVSSSKSPETLENSMLNVMPTVSSNTTVTNASTLQGNDSVSDGPQTPIPQTPVTPITNPMPMASDGTGVEKKKGGFKIGMVLVLILLLVIIAVGVYFFFFRDKENNSNSASNVATNTNNETSNSNTNPNVSDNVMSLEELSQSFNSLDSIKKYNEVEGYSIASSVEGNKFVITISLSEKLANGGPTEIRTEGILEGNILVFKSSGDTNTVMTTAMMSVLVLTSKAVKDGILEHEATTVLSGTPVGNLKENGYEITSTQTSIECKVDLSKKMVLPNLSDAYITENDLDILDGILEYKSGSANGHVGMMYYYVNISQINNETTIVVAEKKEFTEKSYQSILSFIKKIYGETELNNFKTQYTKIENKTFGKYKVTLNPQLDDYKTYYDEGYVVVQIIVKD